MPLTVRDIVYLKRSLGFRGFLVQGFGSGDEGRRGLRFWSEGSRVWDLEGFEFGILKVRF